jgi:hypothetical protein
MFDNQIFYLVDQATGLPTDQQVEIEEVLGPDKPSGGQSINQFQQFWRVMCLGARLCYQT